jgi:hypothetical protein
VEIKDDRRALGKLAGGANHRQPIMNVMFDPAPLAGLTLFHSRELGCLCLHDKRVVRTTV